MSLFTAGPAFEHGGEDFAGDRLGLRIGSIRSAIAAWLIPHFSLPREAKTARE